ncbi:single-stranded DNA-binding protein [Scrofimicrobium sp. R131]|uniref:Single-stranded DNA-binding protein n=1 Tax=Scrofimicrobium appendicitidis TaxID=3079930 RepID=A0AAU7V5G3_9ACTO
MENNRITLTGWLGTDVTLYAEGDDRVPMAQFRMVTPKGRFDDRGSWVEAEGTWYTVKAFGDLALNVNNSLRKGHPVVLVGKYVARGWMAKDGSLATELQIHAFTVGHDLRRGVSSYAKLIRTEPERPSEAEEAGEQGAAVEPESSAEDTGTEEAEGYESGTVPF